MFLEDFASRYAKGDSDDGTFRNLDLASRRDKNVCEIVESKSNVENGAEVAKTIRNKMQSDSSNCRWIDYIEDSGKNDKKDTGNMAANYNYMSSYYQGAKECKDISDPALEKTCETDYRVKSTFRLAFK